MSNRNRALLRIPQGTERFSLEEARRHRHLVHRIEDFFQRWSYLPAQTPIVDFFDGYDHLLTPTDRRDVYRLIDRDGELLMLRSDVTLFLAKQMGLLLREEDLPVRVYYADTILRHQEAHDISRNEFFQTGVELIGLPGRNGEIEVLTLLCELLRHIECPRFYCHLGSRGLFDATITAVTRGSDPQNDVVGSVAELRRALTFRRFDELEALTSSRLSAAQKSMYRTIMPARELSARVPSLSQDLSRAEADRLMELEAVVQALLDLGYGEHLRVDFSEIGNQPYHSGIAFQVYIDGVDSAVVSGGRYDGLLKQFGFDAASVGFSVMLRKLEPRLTDRQAVGPPDGSEIAETDPVERITRARNIVAGGGRVSL